MSKVVYHEKNRLINFIILNTLVIHNAYALGAPRRCGDLKHTSLCALSASVRKNNNLCLSALAPLNAASGGPLRGFNWGKSAAKKCI
jgi:hypothetical protein